MIIDDPKSRVSDLDIWHSAFSFYPELGKKYKNPLRQDRNPGCSFMQVGSGESKLLFFDFGNKDYWALTSRKAYELMFNRSFDPSTLSGGYKALKEHKTSISYLKRVGFSLSDLEYWKQFGIDEYLLKENNVHSILNISINGDFVGTDGPSFVYEFSSGRFKIYQPYSKKMKFIGTSKLTDIHGLDNLKDKTNLIITSSGKDYMCLTSIIDKYNLDFQVIALNTENVQLPLDIYSILKSKYSKWFLILDNDEAGHIATIKLSDIYKCGYTYTEYKDPAHTYMIKGEESLITMLNELVI